MASKDPRYEYKKRWFAEHREQYLAKKKAWRAANPDRVRAYARNRRKRNPEKFRVKGRERYWKNPEKFRAASSAWAKAHPERVRHWRRLAYARQHPGGPRPRRTPEEKYEQKCRRDRRRIRDLYPSYVRKTLKLGTDVPPELLELKRLQLQFHRSTTPKRKKR